MLHCFDDTCAGEPKEPPNEVHGDANCDGLVDSIDAAIILQWSAGLLETLPCADLADANGNGTVDSIDAALVLQFTAHLLNRLPP